MNCHWYTGAGVGWMVLGTFQEILLHVIISHASLSEIQGNLVYALLFNFFGQPNNPCICTLLRRYTSMVCHHVGPTPRWSNTFCIIALVSPR